LNSFESNHRELKEKEQEHDNNDVAIKVVKGEESNLYAYTCWQIFKFTILNSMFIHLIKMNTFE